MASLTESWMMRDCTTREMGGGRAERGAPLYLRRGHLIVDKLCGADFADAGVGIGDTTDVLCLCISPMAEEAILIAMTMGADRTSEFAKRRSSTVCRFPGVGRVSTRAVSRRLNSEHKLGGYPEAGAQVSPLSCLTVSASRKKVSRACFPDGRIV